MLVLERTKSSANQRTLTPARAPGLGGTQATSGRISSEPGPQTPDPGRRRVGAGGDFFTVISPGAKTRSWRGAGRGHAPTRTFHARSQLPAQSGLCLCPVPALPGRCRRAPRRGKGGAGHAEARRIRSRARLSRRQAGPLRGAAPAQPSRGAGPSPGPGVPRLCPVRRAGAKLKSPRCRLRLLGRRPGLAAAWAVARPGRAKDASGRFARSGSCGPG